MVDEVSARLTATGAELDETDGVRVTTPDGWWLLRASNTQDVLVARAESSDQAGLDRLMEQIDAQLAALADTIEIDYMVKRLMGYLNVRPAR